ncbi:LysR family transcriptional regulator [Amycolatopsis sp. NPDC051903]|uniref:LysR family transcriptional regulator n=1 Tax=Amycolatopsis sp. NPDC051903 TaxID=3363936 RepID=UPI0037877E60
MDLRQLEHFVTVAEEGNFTRAAELAQVTQSGLSASIRRLENDLRAKLFSRTTRSVGLTDAGAAFLPHAQAILASGRAGRSAVARTATVLTGTLRVGSEQCLGDLLDLPDLLAAFHQRHPGVEIRFEQHGSDLLWERLHAGQLDIGLVAGGSRPGSATALRPGRLTHAEIGRESLVAVCHPGHRLAHRTEVEWADLAKDAFADLHETWAIRRILDEVFGDRGLHRHSVFSVNDVHALLSLVQRDLAVTVLPASMARKPEAEGLVRLSITDDDTPDWVAAAVRGPTPSSPAAVESFAALIPGARW